MNFWFKKLKSTDATPGFTKFTTLYIMPIMIIGCGYGFWYVEKLLDSTLSEFKNVKTLIRDFKLQERSNNKLVETIYTDLYLTTSQGQAS
jgi:hypothetical protein